MNEDTLKVFRPIQSNRITQKFSENKACMQSFRGIYPLKVVNKIGGMCPPGFTGLYEAMGMKGHNGQDWAAWHKEPCYFPVEIPTMTWRAITEVDRDGGKGVNVVTTRPVNLKMPDGYYKSHYLKFRFWHLFDFAVYDEQPVSKGQLLGYCDSTGASTNTHLHWDMKFCTSDSSGLYKDNGYHGSIDFSPWFTNEFVSSPIPQKNNLLDEINRLMFLLKR